MLLPLFYVSEFCRQIMNAKHCCVVFFCSRELVTVVKQFEGNVDEGENEDKLLI